MSASRVGFDRPSLPHDYDDSRARERRADPSGWRFADDERAAVIRAITERRDIRRFRPDPLPDGLLRHLLEAAHAAPSVGLMQPWRFVLVEEERTKQAMHAIAARERLVQGEHFDARAREFLDLKVEGIREAPIGLLVCCDRDSGGPEVLGRHTIRDTDIYSTCCAIQNFWLAARAEGVGVGWVSFYRPEQVAELFELPDGVLAVAYLCVGYPDERPRRPGLEAAGWKRRAPLDGLVFSERWGGAWPGEGTEADAAPEPTAPSVARAALAPWLRALVDPVAPGEVAALQRVRDESDELVKPRGSLGVLESLVERWAAATGAPPPSKPRAAILVFAADHGITGRDVSLFPQRVTRQVASAAASGGTTVAVLARALDAPLTVVDIGLSGARVPGLLDRRVADGSADLTAEPAMSEDELQRAVEAGHEIACELVEDVDVLLVGEIGIGNTTTSSALYAALSGRTAAQVCGRGTGLDAQGVERKRAVVAAGLARHMPELADAIEPLRRLGGLEFAALAGAMLGAASKRRPVVLDGFATGVAALAACRVAPALRDYLFAAHRSSEPAHADVLVDLGLEPLLDLRLRLGEASGAALAFPLIGLAGRLHAEMQTFDEAGVDGPATPRGG
jgi:nicotinate-nucleotide--dimethylbenzimidazole phosphoribosyltransferase